MIVQVQGAGPGPQRPGRAGDLLDRLPLDAQGRNKGTDLGRSGLSAEDLIHGPFHFLIYIIENLSCVPLFNSARGRIACTIMCTSMVRRTPQFPEQGHRGFQVAEDLPINGNQVSLGGKFLKSLKTRCKHSFFFFLK